MAVPPVAMKVLKPVVFLLCLWPVAAIFWAIVYAPESFGVDYQGALTDRTGDWTLRFILICLAMTPLRMLTGWNGAIRFRRMLGLAAFFYGFLHLITYVWFTKYFDFPGIVEDVVKRKFITVGMTAFVLMIPLAITSTKGWISRLGGKRWQFLHKAVYITAILGVVHYLWRVKSDIERPLIYGILLAFLLGYRLWNKFRPAAVVR